MIRSKFLLGLAAGLLLACGEAESTADKSAPPVAVAAVTVADLPEEIQASGELLAVNQAKIAAEVGGRITEIVVEEGRPVEVGNVVLSIDPEARELELKGARASMTEASAARSEAAREAKRVHRLKAKSMASQSQLDAADTAYQRARSQAEAAEARLGVAERALREASVAAPFSGLVAERYVSPGEYVQPGQPLFELVALDPIEVEFMLPEADSSRVALGNSVVVRVAPYPDEEFEAIVTFISPTIEPRTRTLRVKATLQNPDGRLRPGLFARADLGIAMLRDLTLVPEEAVLQRVDGAVLFVLRGNRVERIRIEVGRQHGGMIEVREGLASDATVVVRGHTRLSAGQRVQVRNPDGSAASPAVAAKSDEDPGR